MIGPDGPTDLGPRKRRSVLAALALTPGRMVPADHLAELVWGGDPPPGAHGTLHAYISTLRRALEPDLAPRAHPTVLLTTDDGYLLDLPRHDVDAAHFTDEIRARHRQLAPLASQLTSGADPSWPSRTEVVDHVEALESLLSMWAGVAFADLPDHPDVLAERAALEETRVLAEEDRALALLALGEHQVVIVHSEQMISQETLRERAWAIHALALTRAGRQADALASLRDVRGLLNEELGLDPGPELRELEASILRQDPALTSWLAPATPPAAPGSPGRSTRGTWDLVGRRQELQLLDGLLTTADGGSPAAAIVVADPGMGKTRLVEWTVQRAAERGFLTAVGRCSQDDGAPPLWPWHAVLDSLDSGAFELDSGGQTEESRAFELQDALARTVLQKATDGPVLVVLEDLHWADTASLRALAHLVANTAGERLMILTTRRRWPQPAGVLADLGVTLARHAAEHIELSGLDPGEARSLLETVAAGISPDHVDAWYERTGGNPFFLIELARLSDPSQEVPASVQQVVARRLEQLPEATRELLLVSAALGREHSLLTLALATGQAPQDIDEDLDAARQTGIIRDDGDGRLAFEHALTRDAVVRSYSRSRVARVHARIAYALESADAGGPDDRTFELAHHWLAAGPVHADRAWRAAGTAAQQARRSFAHTEAIDLLVAAITAHRLDPRATTAERYDLLVDLATVASLAARWDLVLTSAREAVAIARASDDPERVARAAAELTRSSVWTSQEYETVDEDLVDDLRAALARSGGQDSATRCTLMLALSCQLYYAPGTHAEIDALVAEGMAMARRLDDPALLQWAARTASLAIWRSDRLDERQMLAAEEVTAARRHGDELGAAIGLVTMATNAIELGERAAYEEYSRRAAAIARRRRLYFAEFVLDFMDLNLAAMRGDADDVAGLSGRMREIHSGATLLASEFVEFGINYSVGLWDPDVADGLAGLVGTLLEGPSAEFALDAAFQILARSHHAEELGSLLDRHRLPPVQHDWGTVHTAAARAEIAHELDDPVLAAQAAQWLRRYSGRIALSGSSVVLGPADGYLAMAEATVGNGAAATTAADRALTLASAWNLTRYTDWLLGQRQRAGF